MLSQTESSFPNQLVLKEALLNHLEVPVVFKNQIKSWDVPWTEADLVQKFNDTSLDFRIVPKVHEGVSWEGEAKFVQATIPQFISWLNCNNDAVEFINPLKQFDKEEYWGYSSYNYMNFIFAENPEFLKAINWSAFGFPDVSGNESTFWLGSEGAYTPCHFDSYGVNLVAQIIGRKKWVLFPPQDTFLMYPSRIPYEESSIFSSVNILNPDLSLHPLFEKSHPHIVVLEPGDVLFVPKKWWHFVLSLDNITVSINTWLKQNLDVHCRLEEGVVRSLMSCFINCLEPVGETWLNPKEELVLPDESITYIITAVEELINKKAEENSYNQSCERRKVCKTTTETDIHSEPATDTYRILDYKDVVEIKPVPFSQWVKKTNQGRRNTTLPEPAQEITLKKIVNCFVHPEVVTLISRLLQQNLKG